MTRNTNNIIKIVHFVIIGENERYWNERSVTTRAERVWIVSEFQYCFQHELQTVLLIIHALNEKLRVKEINRK